MNAPMLQGKRIGIIVENKFIFEEIEAYKSCFALLGAKVDFISRLSDKAATQTFYSDVDPFEDPWTTPRPLKVSLDFSSVNVEDYSAIIMVANYPSVRLRWTENPAKGPDVDVPAHVASAPAVKFFASAMRNSTVVKGALCHGLWIATPIPNPALLPEKTVLLPAPITLAVLVWNRGRSM